MTVCSPHMRHPCSTERGRSVSDTQMLQVFFQSSFIRDSQSLPKRDGPELSTTRSQTSAHCSWYFRSTLTFPYTLTGCPV